MADDSWLLKEDGSLQVEPNLKQIVYHPLLNIILICTDYAAVHVLDVNSGIVLHSCKISAQETSKVTCSYLPGQDRILFCDGFGIGARSDYNGVLLLDTILQRPVSSNRDVVKLELLLSEATLFKQSLSLIKHMVVDNLTEVTTILSAKINDAQKMTKKGVKAQKWNTVCLEMPLENLQKIVDTALSEFTMKSKHIPELTVIAAIQERLYELLNNPPILNDRIAMASEARRKETFSRWPHMDYKWALPDQMAQAGFYHQPNNSGDDRAMCFTCTVCLVCWERTDEPWSEHERHSPNCPFVLGEYTQNVPISVTYATAPALDATYRGSPVNIVGSSGVSYLIVTANEDGLITVYDTSEKLKSTHSFYVTQYDSPILECCMQEFGHNYSWSNLEDGRSVAITALTVVGDHKFVQNKKKSDEKDAFMAVKDTGDFIQFLRSLDKDIVVRPVVICGITIKGRKLSSTKNESSEESQIIIENLNEKNLSEPATCLCLVVYDFQYMKETNHEQEQQLQQPNVTNTHPLQNIVMAMIGTPDYCLNDDEDTTLNTIHLQTLNQTEVNNYQNLIPGDTDNIYLPPEVIQSVVNVNDNQLLVNDNIDMEQPDASSSLSIPNYEFLNGQLNLSDPSSEKSISDHISELKASKTKKLNYSHAIKCVTLPSKYKNKKDLEIFEILATKDKMHILVVLRSISKESDNVLLVYALRMDDCVTNLEETPVAMRELPKSQCPIEVTIMPTFVKTNTSEMKLGPEGTAAVVATDGTVRLFDLATLNFVYVAQNDTEKFVSATYCNSLERICTATSDGSLHFFAINDLETIPDEYEEEEYFSAMSSTADITAPSSSSKLSDSLPDEQSAHNQNINGGYPIISSEIQRLHLLCALEPLNMNYCAVVPPCWSEMQQVQRQRRHPQISNFEEQYTRTWRLQTDSTTWDEHLIEITLPWPAIVIGHLDVSFSLHGYQSNPPHVEITLLRQHTLGHRRNDMNFQVDDSLNFECLQRNQNPVTTKEYLRFYNADILAGPINLADCLDTTEETGCVTLTSPKLFKVNTRSLLLHIKALVDPSKDHATTRKEHKRHREPWKPGRVYIIGDPSMPNPTIIDKSECYIGCDCIHELSITIYKAKCIEPADKIQRTVMLESNIYLCSLVQAILENNSVYQSLALDIMIWIVSVRLTRNRGINGEPPAQQFDCLRIIEAELENLVKQCFFVSGRSIARKCVKLIVICCTGAKNINERMGQDFDFKVFEALMKCLPRIGRIWSAGSLHWLVTLLLRVVPEDSHLFLGIECIRILKQIAIELRRRTNPYHLLLRSHFGLFGTPLETKLFDIDPPSPIKSTSTPITYASIVAGEPTHAIIENSIDYSLKDFLIPPSSDQKRKSVPSSKYLRGLLETEPLHFMCISASEGTRVERFDTNNPRVNLAGVYGPVAVQPTNQQNSGTKKTDDDAKDKENVTGLGELDITLEPTVTPNAYTKELSQLIFNVEPPKSAQQEWPILTNKLDGLEMSIDDSDMCSTSEQSNVNPNANLFNVKSNPWQRIDHLDLMSASFSQFSLQQLLITPPQQVIVVERMQSGARRFVTLDFGTPILLTDVIIPSCPDLLSLSLDLWLQSEDLDSVRLTVSTDIATKCLVLSDLQPPPICQYVKITAIGKYGMSTTRCKIPIGNFYGHVIILPNDIPLDMDPLNAPNLSVTELEQQLSRLTMLLEDINCRYSLACTKLKDLLDPILTSNIPNTHHMAAYMFIIRNFELRDSIEQQVSMDTIKIFAAYQEVLMYQRQLNIVQGVIHRIEDSTAIYPSTPHSANYSDSCSDKLRVISETLLDVLLNLSIDMTNNIDLSTCEQMFHAFCVGQGPRLQMLTASFLVKNCEKQTYWGHFISDTLFDMYSSSYARLFPQDRVFILLLYLGKKTPQKGIILDANLRALAKVLCSLAGPKETLLAIKTDFSLMGWMLLYISMMLDYTYKSDTCFNKRWNWISGENNRKMPDLGNLNTGHRRKLHRKFTNKEQTSEQIDWTKKVVPSQQVQALSTLSSKAFNLTSKLEAAIRQQETLFKRLKQTSKSKQEENNPGTSKDNSDSTTFINILHKDHILPVARAIATFLLGMDHSCGADLFLLACKVLAKLMVIGELSASQLFDVTQLECLIRKCVKGNHPWIQHALVCLLQEVLDINNANSPQTQIFTPNSTATSSEESFEQRTLNQDEEVEIVMAPNPGQNWGTTVTQFFSPFTILVNDPVTNQKLALSGKPISSNPLPSVFESEDSDLDDFLDDILERGSNLLMKTNTSSKQSILSSVSTAMDARLEWGVESAAELELRRMINASCNLDYLTSAMPTTVRSPIASAWPEYLTDPWMTRDYPEVPVYEMLSICFNNLVNEFEMHTSTTIENTLQLWVTLNKTAIRGNLHSSIHTPICLFKQSISNLITTLTTTPNLSLRAWCISLQALTLICNIPNNENTGINWVEESQIRMARCIVEHPDFVTLFMRLLSANAMGGLAGPSLCKALFEFLVRLLVRCEGASQNSTTVIKLKENFLQILYQLVLPNGPLFLRLGPMDVQLKFIEYLLNLDFSNTDIHIAIYIVENAATLVNSYVTNTERIKCFNLGERSNGSSSLAPGSASHNFSGLFASVLGSESKQDRPASLDYLLITLLKLIINIIEVPLPSSETENTSQEGENVENVLTAETDEIKAERQQDSDSPRTPRSQTSVPARQAYLADLILERQVAVMRFCVGLTSCNASSISMLMGCGHEVDLSELDEPTTVKDVVFKILTTMIKKTSRPDLIIEPVSKYLKLTDSLSEPVLWFVLQVLNNEDTIFEFIKYDGVKVLATNLVRSCENLISNHRGTVSLIKHHLTTSLHSNLNRSDATLSYGVPSFSKKVQQANLENAEALINFAPVGTIKCLSGTAQPADVLIQTAIATHRRARTPQWCYHFYPDETYVDLAIKLPCSVLLREVQLQPHLSSLATCPSAVALEISNGSLEYLIPISPPLSTSGMTFIRLHLPSPEVVTQILLRLYKPRDASHIGLSQIRLLGTYAFTDISKSPTISSEISEEEHYSKYSLGWLRLLYHVFTISSANAELEKKMIRSIANVNNLLESCCGLLLVPTHIPTFYLPYLEFVLYRLSISDKNLGLTTLKILLNSKAALSGSSHFIYNEKAQPLLNSPASDSVCELLRQLCLHEDANSEHRMRFVLDWLQKSAKESLMKSYSHGCSAALVFCIASILWTANEVGVSYPLYDLITKELFDNMISWLDHSARKKFLKKSLDCLLCSLCYIKMELFHILLQHLDVLIPILSTDITASISDDRKDSECMTDDTKEFFEVESEWYGRLIISEMADLYLTEDQLNSIAMASRSPVVVQLLLDSGLPKMLMLAVLEFTLHEEIDIPLCTVENVTYILNFFSEVSVERTMQDWLGSSDGCLFWSPLLAYLCRKSVQMDYKLRSESHIKLEDASVRFFTSICLCHYENQKLFSGALCDVIMHLRYDMSGFMRRLILQLLLEDEKVLVSFKSTESIYKVSPIPQPNDPVHPSHKQTHDQVLLQLSTSTTLLDIFEQHIAFGTCSKADTKPRFIIGSNTVPPQILTEMWEMGIDNSDHIMAAGVTAKDKRVKEAKNPSFLDISTSSCRKKKSTDSSSSISTNSIGGKVVKCKYLPDHPLPLGLTLAQLLSILEQHGKPMEIHLTVSHYKGDSCKIIKPNNLLRYRPIGNLLTVFSSMEGLGLLATYLPAFYPEVINTPCDKVNTSFNEQQDTDWVKVEGCDDLYEDIDDSISSSAQSKNVNYVTNVPPHSLTAFGLFLKLPGFSEVLLRDVKKAVYLLRLVLGVTDDGEGGNIFNSSLMESLPTLPFEVLRQLYAVTPPGTDDGRLLRDFSVDLGITDLLFSCLAIFSHQNQPKVTKSDNGKDDSTTSDDKSHLYWEKGTGFGTGSTQQSWNVEQALIRQRSEEEHVTILLQVLASYINPEGQTREELFNHILPIKFEEQLTASCLLSALRSYLRNDSVLDMARHIPLYRSILQLIRAIARSPLLVGLLLPQMTIDAKPSIYGLLLNLKSCVDSYTYRLRFNKNPTQKIKLQRITNSQSSEEIETDEGLAMLMPDIQETVNIVQQITGLSTDVYDIEKRNLDGTSIDKPIQQSIEHRYLDIMRKLQFDTFQMITEAAEGGLKFVVPYHYENSVKIAGDQSQPARVKRLAQEAVTLTTSLPLNYSSSVFVRCDEDRLDVMKVLITGPADTPYANGCFEFDVYFPPEYPNAPMQINLETTGHHTVRFNPNLYNDGKVCLSVLNTWHGRPEEKWNSQTSSFLQVLVSIQSLILVPEPYFNEPGYERSRGTPSGNMNSREYNSNVCHATVRWAMIEQIMNPCACFKQVIHTHFWLKRNEILAQVDSWIADLEAQLKEKRNFRGPNKRGTYTCLGTFKKLQQQLRDQLAKLTPPDGLEDLQNVMEPIATMDILENAENIKNTENATLVNNVNTSDHLETVENLENPANTDVAEQQNAVSSQQEDNSLIQVDIDADLEKIVSDVCE